MANITQNNNFSLTPKNLDEAMKYSDIIAKSSIVPKGYQNRPGDVLVAVQMGSELGLQPLQALQNIAVINGRPSIWGDALLAIVKSHPQLEDFKEYFEGDTAICEVKRKGQSIVKATFSIDDAKKAGLWGKSGPWQTYPKRMLAMRARGFALRDAFPDALKGLITAEEAQDYPNETKDVSSSSKAETISEKIDVMNNSYREDNNATSSLPLEDKKANLFQLISEYDIPEHVISKWCQKAEVKTLEHLEEDKVDSCIDYIKQKYTENE